MLPEDHDTGNKMAAMELAYKKEPLYTGIFYQVDKPGIDDALNSHIKEYELPGGFSSNPIENLHELLNSFS